ncbi:hypothetical protein AOLI_G00150530 [Acnodon oligacanthus]
MAHLSTQTLWHFSQACKGQLPYPQGHQQVKPVLGACRVSRVCSECSCSATQLLQDSHQTLITLQSLFSSFCTFVSSQQRMLCLGSTRPGEGKNRAGSVAASGQQTLIGLLAFELHNRNAAALCWSLTTTKSTFHLTRAARQRKPGLVKVNGAQHP